MVWLEAALAVCAAFVVGFVAGLELLIYPFAGGLRRASGRSEDAEAKGGGAEDGSRMSNSRPGITVDRAERRVGRGKETLDKNQDKRSEGQGVVGAHLRMGHDNRSKCRGRDARVVRSTGRQVPEGTLRNCQMRPCTACAEGPAFLGWEGVG